MITHSTWCLSLHWQSAMASAPAIVEVLAQALPIGSQGDALPAAGGTPCKPQTSVAQKTLYMQDKQDGST